jgi:hypothetical protein
MTLCITSDNLKLLKPIQTPYLLCIFAGMRNTITNNHGILADKIQPHTVLSYLQTCRYYQCTQVDVEEASHRVYGSLCLLILSILNKRVHSLAGFSLRWPCLYLYCLLVVLWYRSILRVHYAPSDRLTARMTAHSLNPLYIEFFESD